jgi:GNAT superfamily N-acetyltransferase
MTQADQQYKVREATEADLSALVDIKPPVALHRDRLRDADGRRLLYMVVENLRTIIGFGLLVFERPPTWPDAADSSRLPEMVDLLVTPNERGRGAGSFLIGRMEDTVRARGAARLHMGVDPVENPRAHQLYLRLGYTPMQTEPYRSHWKFTDSDGSVHEGDEWNVDMVKDLGAVTQEAPNTCTLSSLTRRSVR